MSKKFKVLAVSVNANDFGLQQAVFVAEDGTALTGLRTSQFIPKKHDTFLLTEPYENALSTLGYECPNMVDPAPQEAIDEVWNVEKHNARHA